MEQDHQPSLPISSLVDSTQRRCVGKLNVELASGRVAGPFHTPPLPNLKISPIGLVPKKETGKFRMIHHLSYLKGTSVNDFLEEELCTVRYTSFDDAIALLLSLGPGSFSSKTDIEDAFRLVPVHPSDHELLGFFFQGQYFYDRCLPMGASSSCAIFDHFSTSLEWICKSRLGIPYVLHILDDFLFTGTTYN